MNNSKISFEERLQKKIDLGSLAIDFFNDSVNELNDNYLPSAKDEWQNYTEFIGTIQHEIWNYEQEGSEEELEALEELDDELRAYFQDFKKLFREKYRGRVESVRDITLRTSHLDLDVRFSPHPAPDNLRNYLLPM